MRCWFLYSHTFFQVDFLILPPPGLTVESMKRMLSILPTLYAQCFSQDSTNNGYQSIFIKWLAE